jgi:Holliday junction resolvase RusA-like endonuclease
MKVAEFVVMGDPVPEGSMCVGRGGHTYYQNDKTLKLYRGRIAEVADAYHDELWTDNSDMGFEISIIFYIYKGSTVKRPLPTVRGTGDIDKLQRAVLDALTTTVDKKTGKVRARGLWPDDSQVVRTKATKYYVDEEHPEPCTYIKVRRVLMPKAMCADDVASKLDDDV